MAVLLIVPGAEAKASISSSYIRNAQTGLCLASNSNGQVWTESCNYGSSEEWYISETPSSALFEGGFAIQNVQTGLWLDSNYAGNVYTDPGNGGAYQCWGWQAHNGNGASAFEDCATFRWLDSNYAGNAYTSPGNGGWYQTWTVPD